MTRPRIITRLCNAALAATLALAPALAVAQTDKPQYGGGLNIGSLFITLSAQSWDPADWSWKFNNDAGLAYEQLFAADLSKARHRGGTHRFVADAWLPPDAIRGELAESWVTKDNPFRVEIQLRKGVMFPAKPGVMDARELTAEDVVYSFERLIKSPKRQPTYFDHVAKVEATGRHTVVFTFKNYNTEWDYRFGWGYYSAIVPREVSTAGAGNWKNVNGSGPFMLSDYVQGSSSTFTRNPNYWDKETLGGQAYKLPFVDKISYRIIKEEATALTALRTAKLDVLELVSWSAIDELKKTAPKLKTSKWLGLSGTVIAMRTDTKPFDDVRVRRALNMAVNKQEIIKSYYGGNAEMFVHPQHPDYAGYYEPLSAMPDSIKELYTYNPEKAKKLLAEAGYPSGFSFKVQVSNNSQNHDLITLVASYLAKVGVKMDMNLTEFGLYGRAMATGTNDPGYYMITTITNPTTSIRKNFSKNSIFNPSRYADAEYDKKMAEVIAEPDEKIRQIKIRLMTREIVDKAPYIWLPVPYVYTAWWPWVKNYGGELRAGAERPGPIHSRMWVDLELKKKMGY